MHGREGAIQIMSPREDGAVPTRDPRYVRAIEVLNRYADPGYKGAFIMEGLKIKFPDVSGGDCLVVVTGYERASGDAIVGFHGGYDVGDALIGLAGRLQNGKMKWRQDDYRDGIEPQ